jgi:predicted small lipoprotein YifL
MVRRLQECAVTRYRHPSSLLALAGVLVLALGLSACGRKGPLELPPAAAVEPAPGSPSAAAAAASPRSRIPLDYLLD